MQLIKKILEKNILFKNLKPVDLVVLDDGFSNLKLKNLNYHNYNQNNYYIIIFLKSLLEFFTNFLRVGFGKIYLKNALKKLNPKVAIGHEMNKKIFYFKSLFPDKISICYQFGYIFDNDKNYYEKNFKNKEVDYYFVYDNRSKKKMSKLIKSNYIINGSTKINENFDKKKYERKYDIMFVSRYRSENNSLRNKYDLFLMNILKNFCNQNKLKLVIALVANRKDKNKNRKLYISENNFYSKYFLNIPTTSEDSFSLAKKSNLVVCSNSNLGYELMFAKKKVVFFNSKKDKHNFFKKNYGPFWYYGDDEKVIQRILEKYVNKKNDKLWIKYILKTDEFSKFYKNDRLYFKNNMIKKTISKILNERI